MRKGKQNIVRIPSITGVFFAFFCLLFGFFSVQIAQAEKNAYGWEKISSYTTYFNPNDRGRCENIEIASALLDGVTLQGFGEFSFNQTVGKRTQEAGFQQAKIIVNGEYVVGVGGGVCQVSTTLYNAALTAGLEVTEYHAHSLKVAYVPPSRDAMVSSQSDLKLFNPYAHPVQMRCIVTGNSLQVCFFGKKNGYRYAVSVQTLGEIPPPAPIVKDGEEDGVLRQEKAGIKSQAFLEIYYGERLISRKKLRVDEYRPIQGIIVKKSSAT